MVDFTINASDYNDGDMNDYLEMALKYYGYNREIRSYFLFNQRLRYMPVVLPFYQAYPLHLGLDDVKFRPPLLNIQQFMVKHQGLN